MSGTDRCAATNSSANAQAFPFPEIETAGAPASRVRHFRWHDDLQGTLFVQCRADQAAAASELVRGRAGSGLVLSGGGALRASRALKGYGFDRPILCDAERYKGRNRYLAEAAFDQEWIASQRRLQGPVLTDSGYVEEGDVTGLRSILERTRRLGDDAIACLPLHLSWLKNSDDVEKLCAEIVAHNVPVALVLEHRNDPLGVQGALRNLLKLLKLGTPIMLLRSDVSALGALCFGALCAAVGTMPALRHLYPVASGGGGGGERPVSILVPHCISYVTTDKVAGAIPLTPDQAHHWVCECDTCYGRQLDHFVTIDDYDARVEAAFCHSFQWLLDIRDELFEPRLTAAARRNSWIERCKSAAFYHEELAKAPLYRDWPVPAFLKAWEAVGSPEPWRKSISRKPHSR